MNKIPEIDLKLETKTVKGGKSYKMTVRNMFYNGFRGKLTCMWIWLIHFSFKQTFKEYLNSSVTYTMKYGTNVNVYHSIDAERELTRILTEELAKVNKKTKLKI